MTYIDYESDNTEIEPKKNWRSSDLQKYWRTLYVKHHKGGGIIWNMKEKSLLKRLVDEYTPEVVANMMETWMQVTLPETAYNFTSFYMKREQIYKRAQLDEEWTWE